MQIDNLSYSPGSGYTTRVAGFTLTHAEDCRFVTGPWDDWTAACNCFISRVTLDELPDGTTTIIPEGYSAGNSAHINWLRAELSRARAGNDRTIYGLIALSIGGWALAVARGIWGF